MDPGHRCQLVSEPLNQANCNIVEPSIEPIIAAAQS
jgi:hypothetical protein